MLRPSLLSQFPINDFGFRPWLGSPGQRAGRGVKPGRGFASATPAKVGGFFFVPATRGWPSAEGRQEVVGPQTKGEGKLLGCSQGGQM